MSIVLLYVLELIYYATIFQVMNSQEGMLKILFLVVDILLSVKDGTDALNMPRCYMMTIVCLTFIAIFELMNCNKRNELISLLFCSQPSLLLRVHTLQT